LCSLFSRAVTPSGDAPTLDEFCVEWLEMVGPTVRATTFVGYQHKVRTIGRYLGGMKLAEITRHTLAVMYRAMIADGLSPRSVAHVHRATHRVLNDAVRWGVLESNAADQVDPPRAGRPTVRTWTAEQARRFLELTAGHRAGTLWRVALTTGMRRSELLGLRWPRVDLEQGMLDVVETLVMVGNQAATAEPKTGSSRRRVALDPVTVQALRDWRERQATKREAFGPGYDPGDWVWAWEDGRPWRPDWVTHEWRDTVVASGLPDIRFHDLRHTWATLALAAGIPAKVVADRLGHSSVKITLDTYTHHVPELDRRAAEQVAGMLERGS
jgi:integrase